MSKLGFLFILLARCGAEDFNLAPLMVDDECSSQEPGKCAAELLQKSEKASGGHNWIGLIESNGCTRGGRIPCETWLGQNVICVFVFTDVLGKHSWR